MLWPKWYCPLWKIDSLWLSDTIWWHRTGSTLAQVMAWCLMAPSYYLIQCWLIIIKGPGHSPEGNFTRHISAINHSDEHENDSSYHSNLLGINEYEFSNHISPPICSETSRYLKYLDTSQQFITKYPHTLPDLWWGPFPVPWIAAIISNGWSQQSTWVICWY